MCYNLTSKLYSRKNNVSSKCGIKERNDTQRPGRIHGLAKLGLTLLLWKHKQ